MDYAALKAFLDAGPRSRDALGYHEVQGFLFAVASAPELVSPAEWLPIVLEALPPDRQTSDPIVDETMALYNEIVGGVTGGAPALPADCQFRDDVLANLEEGAPVSRWSRGFAAGHTWLEESWEALAPKELDEDIGSTMMVLSFFASTRMARSLMEELGVTDLHETADKMREWFPLAMADYAGIGLDLDAARRPVRVHKTGRNEPCPCGSGRKYKKCCGA